MSSDLMLSLAALGDPDAECLGCGSEEFWDGHQQGHPVVDPDSGDEIDWCPGPLRPYDPSEHWLAQHLSRSTVGGVQ